eukprot:scaffold3732_cov129-Isochrysis_galbana.AAC.5
MGSQPAGGGSKKNGLGHTSSAILARTSAPIWTKCNAICLRPKAAAKCSAVSPRLFAIRGSAPAVGRAGGAVNELWQGTTSGEGRGAHPPPAACACACHPDPRVPRPWQCSTVRSPRIHPRR